MSVPRQGSVSALPLHLASTRSWVQISAPKGKTQAHRVSNPASLAIRWPPGSVRDPVWRTKVWSDRGRHPVLRPGWTRTQTTEKEKLFVVMLKWPLSNDPTASTLGWLWTICSRAGSPSQLFPELQMTTQAHGWMAPAFPHARLLGQTINLRRG